MRHLARILAGVAALAAALPAAAFVRDTTAESASSGLCLWWRSRHVGYKINASGVGHSGCDTASAAEAAVTAGMAVWGGAKRTGDSAACTDFTFDPGAPATTTHRAIGRDGVNLVVFREGRCQQGDDPAVKNCWSHPASVIGLTTTTYDTKTGEILDADIELFAWDGSSPQQSSGFYFTCADPGAGACALYAGTGCNAVDIQAVVAHEAGHMLGLLHVCAPSEGPPHDVCPAGTPLMSPSVGSVLERDLAPDDVEGVCSVYPKGAATVTCAPPDKESSGGCSSAGGLGVTALLAVLAAMFRPRGRPAGCVRLDGQADQAATGAFPGPRASP